MHAARLRQVLWLPIMAIGAWPAAALAAPQIQPLGGQSLQVGTTTVIGIDGVELSPNPRIMLPLTGVVQTIRPGATASRFEVSVTLPAGVVPGIYPLRVATAKGISSAVPVSIDGLTTSTSSESTVPAAIRGNVAGSNVVRVSFTGKKGQRFVADIEARRIASLLDPVIELLDARQVPLLVAGSNPALQGDARLETVLPSDGKYIVEIHDALFQAAAPSHFRLRIGELYHADFAMPAAVQRNTKTSVQLMGRLPGDSHVPIEVPATGDDFPIPSLKLPGLIGPVPRLEISDHPEFVEAAGIKGRLQEIAAPCGVTGRLAQNGESDRYRVIVKPGMRLRFSLFGSRIGSALDGVMSLENESGNQLAFSDDLADTTDSGFDFTIPAGVTAVVLNIRDLHGRGGGSYFYRVAISPAGVPDFTLAIFEDRLQLARNGGTVARLRATRAGYNGPIKLAIADLPPGLTLRGDVIAAGTTDTLLTIHATGMSPVDVGQWITKISGTALAAKDRAVRPAQVAESANTRGRPWWRSDIGLAILDSEAITVDMGPVPGGLPLGAALPIPVRVTRNTTTAGPIRLTILTNQVVPKTKDGKDDQNRALRIDGMPQINAGQLTGTARLLVPADLPKLPYDVVIRAELLGANGAVVATAISPARRLLITDALSLALDSPSKLAVPAGGSVKITGRLNRLGEFAKPITVTLSGLPAGIPGPKVAVPPNQATFELTLALPPATKLGELTGIKVIATADGGIKAPEIPISLQMMPTPAPNEKPKTEPKKK
jgi:hypothetical protein